MHICGFLLYNSGFKVYKVSNNQAAIIHLIATYILTMKMLY